MFQDADFIYLSQKDFSDTGVYKRPWEAIKHFDMF